MPFRSINIRAATAIAASLLILLFIAGGITGWWVLRDGIAQRRLVDHTHKVIETTQSAEASMLEAIAERNQALNGAGARQVAAMDAALIRAEQAARDIVAMTADNLAQQRRAQALWAGFAELDDRLRDSLMRRESVLPADLPGLLREAGVLRRGLLALTSDITAAERRLLADRLSDADEVADRLSLLFVILLGFAVLSSGLGLWALYRHLRGSAQRYADLARSQRAAEAANAALAESQDRLQSILDHARDPILLINDGRIAIANAAAAEQFGLPAADMVGQSILDFVPAYGSHGREVLALRADGGNFPAEISIGRYSEAGGGDASVCVLRDVTERRRLEQLKSEFVSTVSHELRTPLTSIRASLGLIVGGVAGEVSDDVRELLEIAHNNSERLVLLVNDILDMEKIESGRLEFRRERQQAIRLLEQAVEGNRAYGAQFGVSFQVVAPDVGDAAVYADAARIQQVLANLLSNAAKFSPQGGMVEASIVADAGAVTFRVRDHGKGIPDEFRCRMFQRFAQADSSDVRQKGGTGLGLSISKAIIEHHGGTIGFEDAEGGGALFWFTLPRLAERVIRPAPTEGVPDVRDQPRRRALVVEDDADVALLLGRILAQQGWDSEVARDAAEAFESLDRSHFDALTLDLMLPDEDGLSLFRRLRQRADGRALPVIVISAIADQGRLQLNGDAVGVVDWLDKPIDQSRLREALRHALHASDENARILHVEDDHDIVRVVAAVMGDEAEIIPARSLAEARAILATDPPFALVIVDVGLPDGSGLDLLGELRHLPKPPPVLIFSASDYDSGTARHVAASLVKSRTENRELQGTIRHLIESLPPAAERLTP